MAKGRLRAFLLSKRNQNFIGPVEPPEARGFDADVVVFERRPNLQDPQDWADYCVFRQCTAMSHGVTPLLAVPME